MSRRKAGLLPRSLLTDGKIVLAFIGLLWLVEVLNALLEHRLNQYGIVPRRVSGLVGIPLSPFLHANIVHLTSNTFPLLILGLMVAARGSGAFVAYSVQIGILGGIGVWLFGRQSVHIGASGLLFGYFGFILASAWFQRKPGAILVALMAVFLYSGLIWGVFPTDRTISWEAHLFGLIAGVLVARLQKGYRK